MAAAISLASCIDGREVVEVQPQPSKDLSTISAVCEVDTKLPAGATKAMDEWAAVDQTTTRKLDANFLRKNENKDGNNDGDYTFPGWSDAYLCEATVISSPDNTAGIYYRSILFSPRQVYDLRYSETDTTNFYHTRMVGWYPKNCSLIVGEANQQFNICTDQDETYTDAESGKMYKAVKFTGLDGSKDIMVSNVCEGQHWHSRDANYSPHTNEHNNNGGDGTKYRVPFGHYQSYDSGNGEFRTKYKNFFKFRHYLSGIRIWGFVPEQNTHALEMWGNITDVVLLNQPTSVCISLPEEPLYDSNGESLSWESEAGHFNDSDIWGKAYEWGDRANFSVQTGPMFGDDTNHSNENFTVDFSNLSMEGIGDREHAMYLGYSLIQPDQPVQVQIHTRYGVYVTTIDKSYTYEYKDAHGDTQKDTVDLFQPGFYYDVYLSLETDGTISAIIETRGEEKFFDLTRSVSVSPAGSPEDRVTTYKYANCYIVDPEDDIYDTVKTGDSVGVCDYDGFFFSAMVPGNGSDGILNYGTQRFYPETAKLNNPITAHLIWESSRSLVTDVELINGYVKFKVPGITDKNNYNGSGPSKTYSGRKGNAVIGVYDKEGVCLWSWHIWITDTPKDIVYTSGGGINYTYMDRNLGATYGGVPGNAEQALASYGLYYQWGRKDPFVGPSVWNYSQQDCSTAEFYDYASDAVDSALPMSMERPTLKDAVENPMNLLLPTKLSDKGYNYDWLYIEPQNVLWGHQADRDSKTIYDPCPFGYKVPAGELSTVMESSGNYTPGTYGLSFTSGITQGAASATLFMPYAGYKGVDKSLSALTSSWSYVSKKGDYQEAMYNTVTSGGLYHRKRILISSDASWNEDRALGKHPYYYGSGSKNDASHLLAVNGSNVFIDWTNRRTAASVRCVKDTSFDVHP